MNVKALRKKMGLTQTQFAYFLGVSFATINRWERGHFDPLPDRLKKLKQLERDVDETKKLLKGLYD